MTAHRLELGLAGAALLLSAVAGLRWQRGLDGFAAPRVSAGVPQLAPAAPPIHVAVLDSAADMAATNDPFRLANAPSAVAYDPRGDMVAGIVAARVVAAPMRPTMLVRGIIGGPPWQAIIDGIPGQAAGTIVRDGMTFDRLSIRSVSRDTVTVQAPDTIWKLTIPGR